MQTETDTKQTKNFKVFLGDQYNEYLIFKRNSNNLSNVIRIITEIYMRYNGVKSKRKIM